MNHEISHDRIEKTWQHCLWNGYEKSAYDEITVHKTQIKEIQRRK